MFIIGDYVKFVNSDISALHEQLHQGPVLGSIGRIVAIDEEGVLVRFDENVKGRSLDWFRQNHDHLYQRWELASEMDNLSGTYWYCLGEFIQHVENYLQ